MTPDDILKQPSRFAMAKALPSRRLRRDPVDAVSDAAVLLSALRHSCATNFVKHTQKGWSPE